MHFEGFKEYAEIVMFTFFFSISLIESKNHSQNSFSV